MAVACVGLVEQRCGRASGGAHSLRDLLEAGVSATLEAGSSEVSTSSALSKRVTRLQRAALFLRDRRMLAAQLEKGCSPREFYQGFYMEPSEDGLLCVNRARLMSRSGAKCKVARLHQMVLETVE